jgi:hypothetical protein
MKSSKYEALRLGIEKYIEYTSVYQPDLVDGIEEHVGAETLIGRVVSANNDIYVGEVSVPIINLGFLRRLGNRATASFAETHFYGHARRIWLPGKYYDQEEINPITVTNSDSLAESWQSLSDTIPHPTSDYEEQPERLIREALGIAKDIGVAAMPTPSFEAVILFPTK